MLDTNLFAEFKPVDQRYAVFLNDAKIDAAVAHIREGNPIFEGIAILGVNVDIFSYWQYAYYRILFSQRRLSSRSESEQRIYHFCIQFQDAISDAMQADLKRIKGYTAAELRDAKTEQGKAHLRILKRSTHKRLMYRCLHIKYAREFQTSLN